jgi:thymidylate synthase
MNNIERQYQQLLQDILDNGVEKKTRNGDTISVFGRQIRHDMKIGFPLLTTKKMAFKTMVVELLWFLRGDTSIEYLLKNDCNIWTGDAYKSYTKEVDEIIDGYRSGDIMGTQPHIESMFSDSDKLIPLTKDEFIKKIKTDEEFAERFGNLGKIYGHQWRNFNGEIDQISELIMLLKESPDSRRMVVNAWNASDLPHQVLPPCHYGFQVYTRELTVGERLDLASKTYDTFDPFDFGFGMPEKVDHNQIDELYPVPKRAISLMFNMRSSDTFLGLPFNIASYGLLLEIIAKEVNMVPDELIGNLGDVHLYKNHIEQAKEQMYRRPYDLPKVQITERNWYQHELVKEHLGEKTFSEKIMSYRPDCFELVGYQSHDKIKAPLSN